MTNISTRIAHIEKNSITSKNRKALERRALWLYNLQSVSDWVLVVGFWTGLLSLEVPTEIEEAHYKPIQHTRLAKDKRWRECLEEAQLSDSDLAVTAKEIPVHTMQCFLRHFFWAAGREFESPEEIKTFIEANGWEFMRNIRPPSDSLEGSPSV